MKETVLFAKDIVELKKIAVGAGGIAALVRAVSKGQPIWSAAISKLPYLLPLSSLNVPEVLPEALDISQEEAVELVTAFYSAFTSN